MIKRVLHWLRCWITWFPHNPKHFRLSITDLINITFPSMGASCEPWDSTFTMDDLNEAYELIKPTIERREKLVKEVLKHPLGRMHLEMVGINVPMELPELVMPVPKQKFSNFVTCYQYPFFVLNNEKMEDGGYYYGGA